jgi:hypothetical protein
MPALSRKITAATQTTRAAKRLEEAWAIQAHRRPGGVFQHFAPTSNIRPAAGLNQRISPCLAASITRRDPPHAPFIDGDGLAVATRIPALFYRAHSLAGIEQEQAREFPTKTRTPAPPPPSGGGSDAGNRVLRQPSGRIFVGERPAKVLPT